MAGLSTDWVDKLMRGENPPGRIPLEAVRIFLEADDTRSKQNDGVNENNYRSASQT